MIYIGQEYTPLTKFNHSETRKSLTVSFTNSEDTDKKRAIRHLVQVCNVCLNKVDLHRKKYTLSLEYIVCITCDRSIYRMDLPDFIVCSFMENSIRLKRGEMLIWLYLRKYNYLTHISL